MDLSLRRLEVKIVMGIRLPVSAYSAKFSVKAYEVFSINEHHRKNLYRSREHNVPVLHKQVSQAIVGAVRY